MDRTEDMNDSVLKAQKGDMQAFQSLYDQSVTTFRAISMKYMKNVYDADDVLQDAYMKIFQSLNTLEDPDKFISWGSRICKNTALNAIRKKDVFQEHQEYRTTVSDDDQTGLDVIPVSEYDTNFNPEANIDAQETKRLLDEMLDQLPEMQRACILLWQEQYSTREIAEQLGIPEGTVKSNINYAKKKIKESVLDLEKKGTKLYGMAPMVFFLWIIWKYNSGFRPSVPDNTSAAAFSKIAEKAQSASASGNQNLAGEQKPDSMTEGQQNAQIHPDAGEAQERMEEDSNHTDHPTVESTEGTNPGGMNAQEIAAGSSGVAAGTAGTGIGVRILMVAVAVAVFAGGAYAGDRIVTNFMGNNETSTEEETEASEVTEEFDLAESDADSGEESITEDDADSGEESITEDDADSSEEENDRSFDEASIRQSEAAENSDINDLVEQYHFDYAGNEFVEGGLLPTEQRDSTRKIIDFDIPVGYVSAYEYDFDGDSQEEILLVQIGESEYPEDAYLKERPLLTLEMYEEENDQWELADTAVFSYFLSTNTRIDLFARQSNEEVILYIEDLEEELGYIADGVYWGLTEYTYNGEEWKETQDESWDEAGDFYYVLENDDSTLSQLALNEYASSFWNNVDSYGFEIDELGIDDAIMDQDGTVVPITRLRFSFAPDSDQYMEWTTSGSTESYPGLDLEIIDYTTDDQDSEPIDSDSD